MKDGRRYFEIGKKLLQLAEMVEESPDDLCAVILGDKERFKSLAGFSQDDRLPALKRLIQDWKQTTSEEGVILWDA